jgi:hypothetical protein
MNTKNIIHGRFSLVSSTWLLALALGASVTACGAAPDGQGGEFLESTAASADQRDSDAGPAEPASGSVAPAGPLDPGRPGKEPVRLGYVPSPYADQAPGAR